MLKIIIELLQIDFFSNKANNKYNLKKRDNINGINNINKFKILLIAAKVKDLAKFKILNFIKVNFFEIGFFILKAKKLLFIYKIFLLKN